MAGTPRGRAPRLPSPQPRQCLAGGAVGREDVRPESAAHRVIAEPVGDLPSQRHLDLGERLRSAAHDLTQDGIALDEAGGRLGRAPRPQPLVVAMGTHHGRQANSRQLVAVLIDARDEGRVHRPREVGA